MSMLFQLSLPILMTCVVVALVVIAISISGMPEDVRQTKYHLGIQGPMLEELLMDLRRRQKRRIRKPKKDKAHGENAESSPKDAPGA